MAEIIGTKQFLKYCQYICTECCQICNVSLNFVAGFEQPQISISFPPHLWRSSTSINSSIPAFMVNIILLCKLRGKLHSYFRDKTKFIRIVLTNYCHVFNEKFLLSLNLVSVKNIFAVVPVLFPKLNLPQLLTIHFFLNNTSFFS